MIVLGSDAPSWAPPAFQQVDAKLDQARLGPFVSFTTYDAAGDLPAAAENDGKMIFLENGTFWIAKAVAGVWLYPDNSPV